MNRKAVMTLLIITPLLALPFVSAFYSAPVIIDEGHAITPYLVTQVTVFFKNPELTTSVTGSAAVKTITLDLSVGFIPAPEKAVAIAKINPINGLHILSNETSMAEEYKTDADKLQVDAKLDFLHPVAEIDIIQANASWVSVNPINSTGKYHLLLIDWDKNYTLEKIYLDDNSNHTDGFKVLWNKSFTGNLFWYPIPCGNWSYIYLEFSGSEIPAVKLLKNAIPVQDHRLFTTENVVTKEEPETLENDQETTNVFVGVKNLHQFILDIIKEYVKEHFGVDEVYGYNVTYAKFSLKIGKYIKYQGTVLNALQLALLDGMDSIFSTATLTIGTTLDQIKEFLQSSTSLDKETDVTTAVVTSPVAQADSLGADFVKLFTSLGDNINEALSQAGLSLQTITDLASKSIGEILAQAKESIVDFTGEMLVAAKVALGAYYNYTIQFAEKAFGAVTALVQKAKWMILAIIIAGVIIVATIVTVIIKGGIKRRF